MTLRTAIEVILGLAAALFGVAVALGIASLPKDWSRIGAVLPLASAWVLWELLLRVRARAYGSRVPPAPSQAANRVAIAIAVLIAFAVVVAIAAGWLRP